MEASFEEGDAKGGTGLGERRAEKDVIANAMKSAETSHPAQAASASTLCLRYGPGCCEHADI